MNSNNGSPVTESLSEQATAYAAAIENENLIINNLKSTSMKKEETGKPEEQVLSEVCNTNPVNTNIKYLLPQAEQEFCNKAVNDIIARLEPNGLAGSTFNTSIINLTGAEKAGLITVAKLKMNRIHRNKAIENIMESFQECGQQIMLLVIPGVVAEKYGYSLERFDGTEIPEEQKEEAVGILDGQGRYSACQKLLKENPSMAAPDLFAYFPINWIAIDEMLKSINLKQSPWKNSDFMTGVLNNKAITEKTKEALKFIQKLEADGYNYTAACEFVTMNKGIIRKTPLVKAMSSNESSLEFDKAEFGIEICKAAQKKFAGKNESAIKNKTIPELIIDKWNTACKELSQKEATKFMTDFIGWIDNATLNELVSPSGYVRGQGKKKADLIRKTFNKAFKDFLTSHPYSEFKDK